MLFRAKTRRRGAAFFYDYSKLIYINQHTLWGVLFFVFRKLPGGEEHGPKSRFSEVQIQKYYNK